MAAATTMTDEEKDIAFADVMYRGRIKLSARDAWFAVRTAPGSQKPQREYSAEKTRSAKGYRIVPSLNPNLSAIERALLDAKFEFWMPAEKRLVRDRRHTDLWKVRRFALMVGYVFIREPHDFGKLGSVPGVAGIVRDASGEPVPIDFLDILAVRSAEADAEVEFDKKSRQARQTLRKNARTDPRLKKLAEKLDIAGNFTVVLDKLGTAA